MKSSTAYVSENQMIVIEIILLYLFYSACYIEFKMNNKLENRGTDKLPYSIVLLEIPIRSFQTMSVLLSQNSK